MKKLLSFLLIFALIVPAAATSSTTMGTVAKLVYRAVDQPAIGTVGGEWAVLGLRRSGYTVDEGYYDNYYARVETQVKTQGGVLHTKKYTEYSRVVLALTAIGRNPENVGGYNLLTPLGDYERTAWQGINGPIWALIALDSGGYAMPINPTATVQATREMYVNNILQQQRADGGWALVDSASDSDVDITAMALQALTPYHKQSQVSKAIDKGLGYLSSVQNNSGGFTGTMVSTVESCAQVMVALCALDIGLDDPRFVKNGATVLDGLLENYRPGQGFLQGGAVNQMATEQGLYALVALWRRSEGAPSLYDMTDAYGLADKHPDVKIQFVVAPWKTFFDAKGTAHQLAIETLARRGIVNGTNNGDFLPNAYMTRGEFSTMMTKALGLTPVVNGVFRDVATDAWYAPYVGAMNVYGIVQGVGDGRFLPDGTITCEQAFIMVNRGAALCGLSQWDASATLPELQPKSPITRGQLAQLVYHLLQASDLL